MRSYIILLVTGLMILSCQSSDDEFIFENRDYLIFGHFYGMCVGEGCVQTFKLTENSLYKDAKSDYFGSDFEFYQLDQKLFDKVKDLKNTFPKQLLSEKDEVIGCPDCADGGGLFIQLLRNEQLYTWRIDQDKANLPGYLHNFVDKVNEKIALINN